jgi:hypothetical protein
MNRDVLTGNGKLEGKLPHLLRSHLEQCQTEMSCMENDGPGRSV